VKKILAQAMKEFRLFRRDKLHEVASGMTDEEEIDTLLGRRSRAAVWIARRRSQHP